jgi:hypothetical protein
MTPNNRAAGDDPVGGADTPGWTVQASAANQRMHQWQRWVVKIAWRLGFRKWATRQILRWDPATRYALAKLFRHSGNYSGGGHR